MKKIFAITRKELRGYFGSPMALIFLGAFLAATLFSFFWVDAFFARGIADVRPLFRWMPVLMIFLVAALTMRQWSEEQRSGTLEMLLTLPVPTLQLVIGKFLAVVTLVVVALALTLFLPITVSMLGNLDWGPVAGGYIASILLAAAYAAIGLFVSSRTDNQIVSLIATALLCGLFYLVGSGGVTDFVGGTLSEVLYALGSGSRFESIERGVLDLRDLFYYLGLTGIFLTLNVVSLESKRWSESEHTRPQRRSAVITTVLVIVNLVAFNVWLYPLQGLRADITAQKEYSLSPTTRNLLNNLEEPLLIRGYFSEKTHPLLAPLVPNVRDLLREYEVASGGRVELEIVDPAQNPELEAEANQVYGITPTPFQVSDRYESSIINSYFDILIRYGDQSTVLSFADLIEVEARRDGTTDVRLRNFEYDMTRSIKKVVYGFQSIDTILASLEEPAQLTLYVTPDTLPEHLTEAPTIVDNVSADIAARSPGNFAYEVVNPDAPDSPVSRQELYEEYGLQPLATALFSGESYYLYMVLEIGEEAQVVYPSGEFSEAEVRTSIESALKRAAPGFLQVVGLWAPSQEPTQDMFGQTQPPLSSWNGLRDALQQEYEVRDVDLTRGQVPADVNVLVIVAPQGFSDKERFTIDQYLMRGGAVVVAAGNYGLTVDQFGGGLALKPLEENLQEMLAHYGIEVGQSLVLDPQNEPFPVPVTRDVGGFQVQEIQAIDYPFFIDVRSDGMAADSPIVSNLPAVTLNWSSPINLNVAQDADRETTVLLRSSPEAWTTSEIAIQPDFETYPELGFPTGEERQSYPLAVSTQGVFESYFKDKPSPFEPGAEEEEEPVPPAEEEPVSPENVPATVETSSANARLVVVGSAEFVDDVVFEISAQLAADRYRNSLQLIQNAVAWSTEDADLLEIRTRGTSARVLRPLSEAEQSFWEVANYALALVALLVIGIVSNARLKNEEAMELLPPQTTSEAQAKGA